MLGKAPKTDKKDLDVHLDPLRNVISENFIEIKEEEKTKIPSKKELVRNTLSNLTSCEEYHKIRKEYEKMKEITMKLKKAYLITFPEYPDLFFINFNKSKESAGYQAHKYFENSYHPAFPKNHSFASIKTKSKRLPQFDKYYNEEKIPIPELMKELNMTFHCSVCGKGNYNYKSYKDKRCYIVEGEGDSNPFTQGYILCYQCYHRFLDIRS